MNYYYDIVLNWNEEKAYEFYEWNDNDNLEYIKKIPIFKIKHKSLLDIVENKIKVSENFLNLILDKTMLDSKNIVNKIKYACLFTDSKTTIALEFNDLGESIQISKLLIDDSLNIIEASFALKECNLEYEIINKYNENLELRQIKEAKNLIILELNNLYKNRDLAKLKYLFYEYTRKTSDDIDYIYEVLNRDITNKFDKNMQKLYYIIKFTYHNV